MGISPVSAIRHPTHMAENEIHTPVMLERTLELLRRQVRDFGGELEKWLRPGRVAIDRVE